MEKLKPPTTKNKIFFQTYNEPQERIFSPSYYFHPSTNQTLYCMVLVLSTTRTRIAPTNCIIIIAYTTSSSNSNRINIAAITRAATSTVSTTSRCHLTHRMPMAVITAARRRGSSDGILPSPEEPKNIAHPTTPIKSPVVLLLHCLQK